VPRGVTDLFLVVDEVIWVRNDAIIADKVSDRDLHGRALRHLRRHVGHRGERIPERRRRASRVAAAVAIVVVVSGVDPGPGRTITALIARTLGRRHAAFWMIGHRTGSED
jgi:hypothetical protein